MRLRPLTRALAGDERPKQFCAVVGLETLLEQTRRRAALAIAPGRTLVALTRAHERFYRPLLRGIPPHCALVQPDNRGTSAAILYGLLRIARIDPTAAVVVLPSDHYVADDRLFMDHVAVAFTEVQARPELIVLLGAKATSAETEYGWIEPAEPIPDTPLFRIRRFLEKPAPALAAAVFARGCLWNTLVMVANIPAWLALVRGAAPALQAAFEPLGGMLGTSHERSAIRLLYSRLPTSSFASDVLASKPSNLAVLPVTDVEWSDWGQPARVLATLARLGIRPEWADRVPVSA